MRADEWSERWSSLAQGAGLDPRESVLLALSGGADSVYLLQVLAASRERPVVAAVHVEHGLRGSESREDARFCSRLCTRLDVPFERRRILLDPEPAGLEARARAARYEALFEAAHDLGFRTILTGHHADDALETVLLRWLRGADLGGLAALKPELELAPRSAERERARVPGQDLAPRQPLRIVRPLISMRREEVRAALEAAGIAWREDSSNRDERFLRNRLRRFVPRLVALGGPSTLDNLRAFGAAVESLERHLAEATAHLTWQPPSHAVATRSRAQAQLGGTLPRAALMRLPMALRRRALWRLVLEATGRGPRRALLDALLDDLGAGRCARHALPRGYALLLRSAELDCVPPAMLASASAPRQLRLPFDPDLALTRAVRDSEGAALPVPGELPLSDGRVLCAELLRVDPQAPPPRGRCEVELDAARPPDVLRVRFARPGDRFHPLGAPGRRPLRRFLADSGVPREERGRVPLVLRDGEIAWVAGLRPAEPFRVGPRSGLRLRLRLLNAALEPLPETEALPQAETLPQVGLQRDLAAGQSALQGELWVGSAR
jgi:tRNA(Ile)-lysidine synthase